ncbi:hypothetical protein [Sneathiella sp.]|uniref:hypothetical protein n=1 Tax=Sneathiella sp. TaxID=1964365 RepID=UPI0026206B96|nr:hypothetical protein [Sneathiella sp.]MDF2367236.1 hypothetical protein [Sneathiella sp.]
MAKKAKIDTLTLDERKKILTASVFEHYRWYLADDFISEEKVRLNKGKLTPELLTSIGRRYEVGRNLKTGENDNPQRIAKELNEVVNNWPKELVERANRCVEIANILREKGLTPAHGQNSTPGTPLSAVTKLVWFIKPDSWTLYDELASKAVLTRKRNGDTDSKMIRYYKILSSRGFIQTSEKIKCIVNKYEMFKKLHGTRIIDKYLLFTGMENDTRDNRICDIDIFKNALPNTVSKELAKLSNEICTAVISRESTACENPGIFDGT